MPLSWESGTMVLNICGGKQHRHRGALLLVALKVGVEALFQASRRPPPAAA